MSSSASAPTRPGTHRRTFLPLLLLGPILLAIHVIHLISLLLARWHRQLLFFRQPRCPDISDKAQTPSKTPKRPKHVAVLLVTPSKGDGVGNGAAQQAERSLLADSSSSLSCSFYEAKPRVHGEEEEVLEECLVDCVRSCVQWASEADEVETLSFFDPNGHLPSIHPQLLHLLTPSPPTPPPSIPPSSPPSPSSDSRSSLGSSNALPAVDLRASQDPGGGGSGVKKRMSKKSLVDGRARAAKVRTEKEAIICYEHEHDHGEGGTETFKNGLASMTIWRHLHQSTSLAGFDPPSSSSSSDMDPASTTPHHRPSLTINFLTPNASFQPFAAIANELVSAPSSPTSSACASAPLPSFPSSPSSSSITAVPSHSSSIPTTNLLHTASAHSISVSAKPTVSTPKSSSNTRPNALSSPPLPPKEIIVPLIESMYRQYLPLSDPDLLIIHHLGQSSSSFTSAKTLSQSRPPASQSSFRSSRNTQDIQDLSLSSSSTQIVPNWLKRLPLSLLSRFFSSSLSLADPPAIQLHGFPPWLLRVTEIYQPPPSSPATASQPSSYPILTVFSYLLSFLSTLLLLPFSLLSFILSLPHLLIRSSPNRQSINPSSSPSSTSNLKLIPRSTWEGGLRAYGGVEQRFGK